MVNLLLAAAFFLGFHLVVAGTRLRGAIVARIGEGRYLGLFSLASVLGMVWLAAAYAGARAGAYVPLWGHLPRLAPLVFVVMLVAFLLALPGLLTPSPTALMQVHKLDPEEPARGILRVTRHPFLWGVSLWAAAHLAVNGDLASLILFGSLLVLSVAGRHSIDARRKRALGYRWARFTAVTSSVPLLAIVDGRNRLRLAEIGAWRLALALLAFAAAAYAHPWLFGVRVLPSAWY